MATTLRCPATGFEAPLDSGRLRSPDGAPLEVHLPSPRLDRDVVDRRRVEPEPGFEGGVWRFRELIWPDVDPAQVVSWPEGDTPLLRSAAIADYAGVPTLRIKHDGLLPTGSFKDRGMTVAMTHARASGARAVACASTGNTAASVAAYAAMCGLPAYILVPDGLVAPAKLTQALAYGATALQVRGSFDDAMRLVEAAAEPLGLALLNSVNPLRVAGQTSASFEILQQLRWEPPDWIALPAGNLGNTTAYARGLLLARQLGWVDRVPRILSVQALGASPFAAAFDRGFDQLIPVDADTVATAIRIGAPVSYERAVRAIRATDGHVIAVTDDAILAAKAIVDRAGVGAEPASCAAVAGVRSARAAGIIGASDRVVAVLTGHLLKDPGGHGRPPTPIEPTFAALAAAVGADG